MMRVRLNKHVLSAVISRFSLIWRIGFLFPMSILKTLYTVLQLAWKVDL